MKKTVKGEDGKEYTMKEKKPFYKKVWFWILAVIVIAIIANLGKGTEKNNPATTTQEVAKIEEQKIEEKKEENKEEKKEEKKEETKPSVPKEYENALKSAESYASTMYMSKKGIFKQLTSEYADKFSKEAAQYAVDNLKWNYKENALKTAKNYQETMHMSPAAIKDQLMSQYADEFTEEEAQYAIDHLDK